MSTSPDLLSALNDLFGFTAFRSHQQEAVQAAVAGRDVLVVMPTGAGKSLCFQLPAALSDGLTLVVSPLVALMRDQVTALRARDGFRRLGCAYLNSSQSAAEQGEVLDLLRGDMLKLLYVAPERFRSQAFLGALGEIKLARFVVDEAHCISEWGHDFRPDYLTLKSVVESLGKPPLMAVTATATLRVQDSIVANLGMREPIKLVGGFNRANLHFAVHRCKSDTERQAMLARALPKLSAMGGSGLIYAATRKGCEEVAAIASRALAPTGKRAAAYHAGLDPNTRNMLQNQWLCGEVQILVATNAFGMGIDKADVRFVVHYVYPESIESYYQEAGRAGRDGRKSRCVILYNFADRRTREWFIENDELTTDDVHDAHKQLCLSTKTDTAIVSRLWWSNALGWNEVKTRLALAELERAELVRRVGENSDETTLKIVQRTFSRAALARIAADLKRRRDERFRRLDEMVGYCKTKACRRRTTLDYFGDIERPEPLLTGEKLFCCDNCENPVISATSNANGALGTGISGDSTPLDRDDRAAMPRSIDGADIHAVLQGLDALSPQVGKARLGKLLRGAASKDVIRFRDEGCPLYGVMKTATVPRIDAFLGALIEAGLLHQGDEDEYFVCRLTRAGREAWQMKAAIDIKLPGARAAAPIKGAGANGDEIDADDLFETLRDWRNKRAREDGVPLYVVLKDDTLLAIATERPQTSEGLLEVKGIGPMKIEKYGPAILEVLRAF